MTNSPGPCYDRCAVMAEAVARARAARRSLGATWTEALGIALRAAWTAAKHQAANLPAAARSAAKPVRVPARDLLLTCRLRDALRCFCVDRVVALADVASGRVCPDPRGYLTGLDGAAA